MLRTSSRLKLLSLCGTLCLLAHAGAVSAQAQQPTQPQTQQQAQQPAAQQRPSQAPPQLERIEPGSDTPTTTIPPRERTRITEKRGNDGMVKEVEVQSGKSRYIMKPNVAAGNAQPGDAQSSAIRAPQWQVMEFDLGNPKKQAAADQSATAPAPAKAGVPARADAPPPPPMEPVEKK
ncbi:hypothetical protein [Telluria aromaticivorans]|uniref:DUF2782 domain-containing protein n=1 Tax=Telluria aromaticivorans TaxID=2725995 RepID=A0A7Y2K1W0_9BURK|nr:hypothetical protein [Telluria aromaticivorans]NNG24565.1 hypothetical protein [Telluria aromaticivorans]